jgi:DNA-binding MarR family transcriptional regulator
VAVEPAFDETIHAPVRLRMCGVLRHVEEMDFAVLRETLGVSDASLSKHLRALAEEGYVATDKRASAARADARRLTWVRLTRTGRAAFDAHVAELRRIAQGFVGEAAAQRPAVDPGGEPAEALRPRRVT